MSDSTGAPAPSPLWYFGYGSNMDRATFIERRGMHPLTTRRAWLEEFRLCFNIPVGPGERGVANLEAVAGACTHGVIYLLSMEECDRLDRTEGVHRGVYQRLAIEVLAEDGQRLSAFTYQSSLIQAGRKPSARYLGLLLAGARHHGLPPHYVAMLESFELAWDEREGPVREK